MQSRRMLYLVSWLSTVSAGIAATLFSVYLPLIAGDLAGGSATPEDISRTGSWAGGAFLFGWALGAFALGALGDRVGRKMALFASVLTCSIGIIATSFVTSLPMLAAIRLLTGAGAGGILLLTAVMVSEAWATGNRARMVGILINAFPVGFILAGLIAKNIVDWRTAYLIGGSTIFLAAAVLLVVKESDWWKSSDEEHVLKHREREHILDRVYRRDLVIGVMLFGSMLVGLWAVFVWMPTWVHKMSSPELAQSNRGLTIIMLGAGSFAGGILSGPLSNALGRRSAAALGYLGCIALTAATFLTGLVPGTLLFSLTFTLSLCIGINQGVLSAYIPELFPTLIRGVATGISMNAGRLLTTVTVFFVGVLVQTLGGYNNAIFTFAGAYVVGLITLMFARETKGLELPR
ncbi:MAG: MFS transporter [Candidatus Kapabacteria bacterium]|nr:MFS transporter [Candidatus Kapabacteria bacterium]